MHWRWSEAPRRCKVGRRECCRRTWKVGHPKLTGRSGEETKEGSPSSQNAGFAVADVVVVVALCYVVASCFAVVVVVVVVGGDVVECC